VKRARSFGSYFMVSSTVGQEGSSGVQMQPEQPRIPSRFNWLVCGLQILLTTHYACKCTRICHFQSKKNWTL